MNKNQKRWGFALLLVLQELWTYQGFFLMAFKLYTFGSWFNYNHWVKVLLIPLVRVSLINIGSRFSIKIWILAFLGKYSNIFVGSQSVSIEVRIIWYQSTGSKISFLSLLSFVSFYHPILFLLCSLFFVLILWCTRSKSCIKLQKKKKTSEKK